MTAEPRPLPGEPLALDLLNTSWNGDDGPVDWLLSDEAVAEFCRTHDHEIGRAAPGPIRSALTEARYLIERFLESATAAVAADEVPLVSAELAAEVSRELQAAEVSVVATRDGIDVSISSPEADRVLAIEAIVNAVTLLRERPARVRSCEHEQCTLWFLDTSKGGRRRWCSMDKCGNRAKARRHYERSTRKG